MRAAGPRHGPLPAGVDVYLMFMHFQEISAAPREIPLVESRFVICLIALMHSHFKSNTLSASEYKLLNHDRYVVSKMATSTME